MIRILRFASILGLVSVLYCLGVFLSWTILVPAVSNVAVQLYVEICLVVSYAMVLYLIVGVTWVEWKDR